MGRKPAVITQSELTRYLKAYRDAGYPIQKTEIDREGTVIIHSALHQAEGEKNPWDEE